MATESVKNVAKHVQIMAKATKRAKMWPNEVPAASKRMK